MIVLPEKSLGSLTVPELCLFSGKKACFLLNRITGTGILVDHILADDIRKGIYTDDFTGKLISRGMCEVGISAVHETEALPSFFLIDMTQGCNFDCCYCLRNPEAEGICISWEMLEKILDRIIAYCRKNSVRKISVQPWGGEPLLELEKVLYIRRKMEKDAPDIDVNITLETNGSRITAEVADALRKADIGIGISIDGPERIHDAQRRSRKGNPTFKEVMSGVRALKQSGFEHMGTITVVTRASLPCLEEILDFFAEEMPEFSLKLNPMHSPGKADALPLEIRENDMPGMMRRITEKVISLWNEGKPVREMNLETALRNLLIRSDRDLCHSHGCRGGRKMIIFDQKGRIFPCEMVDYPDEQLGHVDDGIDLRDSILAAIPVKEYFKPKFKEACEKCPWWYYCQGGCTSSLMYKKGCVEGVDEYGCAAELALYGQVIQLICDDPELALRIAGLDRPRLRRNME